VTVGKPDSNAFPEDGGSILGREGEHLTLGPDSAQEGTSSESSADKVVNATANDTGIEFDNSQYSNRRAGYAEVVRYLNQLNEEPAAGNASSFAKAMREDPELAHLAQSIETQESFVEKAINHTLHATKMKQILTEDREAVVNSAPFRTSKLDRMALNEQLDRLDKAILHEKTAAARWKISRGTATAKLRKLRQKQVTMQVEYVKGDAKARARLLKKIARQHVDFNMWRASHTGPENADYLAWKKTQSVDYQKKQMQDRVEQVRSKLEMSLDKQFRNEFTKVEHEVESSSNHSDAINIMDSIKSLAESDTYEEDSKTNQAEEHSLNEYRDLGQKLDDDMQEMQYHTEEAKEMNTMPRVKLESNEAKIARLKGLYAAGIVRNKNFKRTRMEQIMRQLNDEPAITGKTETLYTMYKDKHPDEAAEQKAQTLLDARVKAAQAQQDKWDAARSQETEKYAARVNSDALRDRELNGMELRAFETKAKYNAVLRLKNLNAKLAKLEGKGGGSSEVKAKGEASELAKKLKMAKGAYQRASVASDHAHQDMLNLKGPPVRSETAVLPDRDRVHVLDGTM